MLPENWAIEEGNVKYYKNVGNSRDMLFYIVHWSDWLSTVIEKNSYLLDQEETANNIKSAIKKETGFTDDSIGAFRDVFKKLKGKK